MAEKEQEPSGDDRRAMPRYPSRADARLFLETDAMRIGISGRLTDVSVSGVGLRAESHVEPGEEIRLELSNPTQRFHKDVRGVVRHSRPAADSGFQIGVELRTRLTPPEVALLRSNYSENPDDDKPTWV